MKEFRQVYGMGRGFVFRISLPGHRFVSTEVYSTAEDAAFRCDVFKSYLVSSYRLTGATMAPSLAPSVFSALLAEAGVPTNDVSPLLPSSCLEYLQNGGSETLEQYAKAQAELRGVRHV